MRIALVDTNPKKRGRLYPLPLLKLGAWRKAEGDKCKLFRDTLPAKGRFDEIWLTTTFTFDIPHALGIVKEALKRAKVVKVGGVAATLLPEPFKKAGAKVHRGLLPAAERFAPDYTLLGHDPEYSISHIGRGCIRKCGFCMVQTLEPKFGARKNWEDDLHPKAKRVLFYDNNWLATPTRQFKADVAKLRTLAESGQIEAIDFNQGLDCRLLTDERADLLQGLPLMPVRFAFDGMHEDGHYQQAILKMQARGFRDFMAYVLYNWLDTPQDFYYRLKESVRLHQELRPDVNAVASFPMRFQPILEADVGRQYVGKHWTKAGRNGVKAILNAHSVNGQVSCKGGTLHNPLGEFEYWFGVNGAEFVRLINYPMLGQLMRRRKGALRQDRAKARAKLKKTAGGRSAPAKGRAIKKAKGGRGSSKGRG